MQFRRIVLGALAAMAIAVPVLAVAVPASASGTNYWVSNDGGNMAAVALMTGSGTVAAVTQPATGRAPAQSCSTTGYLVDDNGNGNLGVHLAPHNGIDTVATYPGSGVTHMGFLCVGHNSLGDPIYVIGGGGLCLDEGSASQQFFVFSEGCNDSSTVQRWILIGRQLENNHFANCLSSGNANGATLGGRSCTPTSLNSWAADTTN